MRPAVEAIVDRRRRTVISRAVTPSRSYFEDVDNVQNHSPVIDPPGARLVLRQRQLDRLPCVVRQPEHGLSYINYLPLLVCRLVGVTILATTSVHPAEGDSRAPMGCDGITLRWTSRTTRGGHQDASRRHAGSVKSVSQSTTVAVLLTLRCRSSRAQGKGPVPDVRRSLALLKKHLPAPPAAGAIPPVRKGHDEGLL